MAKRVTTDQILDKGNQQSGSRIDYKEMMVQLKPDAATGQDVKSMRLVGFPLQYREHSPNKRGAEKGEWVKVPFVDADLNKSFSRICTENDPAFGECPWCKLGYRTSTKYAINVLERQPDGTSKVKVLDKGSTVFTPFADFENNSKELNAENGDSDLCTLLGGEIAHDVRVKVKNVTGGAVNVEYSVMVNPKVTKVTAQEIEMLRAAGEPSAEEKEAIYVADPEMRDMPEWFIFGHNIAHMKRPQAIRTTTPATPKAEMTFSADDNDDETPASVAAPAAKKSKAASMPAAPAALDNPFSEDEDEAEGTILF